MAGKNSRDAIVLVHGLGSHTLFTAFLARQLQATNRRVINWGYRSLLRSICAHGEELAALLQQLDSDGEIRAVHLVTHSMGGIVARTALAERVPRKMRRMVMLAPPNRGSRAATFFGPLFQKICKPISELADLPDSYVCTLPEPRGLEIGIIAANYDALVQQASTRLSIEHDHLVVPTWHTGLLFRQDVAHQVQHFLEQGRFDHPPENVAAGA